MLSHQCVQSFLQIFKNSDIRKLCGKICITFWKKTFVILKVFGDRNKQNEGVKKQKEANYAISEEILVFSYLQSDQTIISMKA